MRGYVIGATPRRRAVWEGIIGTALVPVVDIRPRRVVFRSGPADIYDLDVGRLHEGQLNRLAAHVARVNRASYRVARRMVVLEGVVIRAEGVVIKTADRDIGRLRWRERYATSGWPFVQGC